MKIFIVLFLSFSVAKCEGQTNPIAWSRVQRSRTLNQSPVNASSNDIYINTDRLMSQLEHRILSVVRNDMNGLKQQMNRIDQVNARIESTLSQLKTSIDSLIVNSNMDIFTKPSEQSQTGQDVGVNQKLDSLSLILNTIRINVGKIQRETLATKKSLMKNQVAPQYALIQSRENEHHQNTACTAMDTNNESGIRRVRTGFKQHTYAFCEMDIEDGNWIVIQNRFSGSIDFYRDWNEYKNGFGNAAGEFWMGLENIYELTASRLHELLIIMEHTNGMQVSAKYSAFAIAGESNLYALNLLGKYSGDAGDSLKYHAGMKFSTFDNDNDGWLDGNCARSHLGGWWYNSCDESNLNGRYFHEQLETSNRYQGMYWNSFNGSMNSLKSVKMLIRPIE